MKYFFIALAALIVITSGTLAAGYFLTNTRLGLTKDDKAFENRLLQHLKQAGDKVVLKDIHPGTWTQVCIVTPYSRVSGTAAHALQTDKSNIQIKNSYNALASDGLWGLAFVSPPNNVEYIQISSTVFFYGSGECTSSENAVLEVKDVNKSDTNRLNLLEIQ